MTMQTLIQRAEGGRRQRGIHPICPQPSHWNLSPTCLETPLAKISPKINKMARARGACHFHLPHKVIEGCFRRATAQRGLSDAEKWHMANSQRNDRISHPAKTPESWAHLSSFLKKEKVLGKFFFPWNLTAFPGYHTLQVELCSSKEREDRVGKTFLPPCRGLSPEFLRTTEESRNAWI